MNGEVVGRRLRQFPAFRGFAVDGFPRPGNSCHSNKLQDFSMIGVFGPGSTLVTFCNPIKLPKPPIKARCARAIKPQERPDLPRSGRKGRSRIPHILANTRS